MSTSTDARLGRVRDREWLASLDLDVNEYVCFLTERGYAEATISSYVRSAAHFSYWFSSKQGSHPGQINEEVINQFVDRHLPCCQCAAEVWRHKPSARAALRHLLAMLRGNGICCPPPASAFPSEAIVAELTEFNRYLLEVCGLSSFTCEVRLRHISHFLVNHFNAGPLRLSTLTPNDIAQFVMRYTQRWAPSSIKAAGQSLRSYFRFLATRAIPTEALCAAIPQIAQWPQARLPDALAATEISRLLSAFDCNTDIGKRDYAITRCLLDLGLRRTEVAQLQLDDIDWRSGTISVHGKGKRIDTLPLPDSTGQAIADYLRHGRPQTSRREVFVRHRPPINTPANLDIVRSAIRHAAQRCGLQDRIRGTHIFRRTAACHMVQVGLPFKQIADFLRHRSLDTTTIYAKVDLPALRRVALPWPGSQS